MTDEAELAPIRDAVRALCLRYPGEYWRKLDRERAYPTEFVRALTQEGFLGALIPEEYGGSGLGLRMACAILQEIHKNGCNAAAAHAQMYTMGTLLKHGSLEQKREWLPRIAAGDIRLQAFGVTEAGSGSETLALSTTAVREGGEYVVNGQKIWTSRAEHSDFMILLARTTPKDQVARKGEGLSVFMLDMNAARAAGTLTIRPIRTMMNHATTEVFFDGVRLPADNLIGQEGQGFKYILDGMNAERSLIAAECLGDAEWFIDKASRYVLSSFKIRPSMSQIYCSYLSKFLDHNDVCGFLVDLLGDAGLFDWQKMWILAALLQVKPRGDAPVKVALDVLKDANRHEALRAVAAIYVGRYGDSARRKSLIAAYPMCSGYIQGAIYFSSRFWPGVERSNAKASWGAHGGLNSLLTLAMAKK